ncbi:hypothetical protein RND81_08G073300 [Saponaria officinalis]|uniref:FAR1 domain-containing protein n=1 Tax=Saponaria officinalis TaxID=3572 RepID=A0AAW1J546_SAPOF
MCGMEQIKQKKGGEEKIIVVEVETSELLGKMAENEQKAYEIYNDYAFLMGFSIRRSKQRNRSNQIGTSMKQYCCSKAGYKTSMGKHFSKLNNRTNCLAKTTCYIDEQGIYTIGKHHMEHNHQLCPEDKRHLLHSQRNVSPQGIEFLMQLVSSGVKLSDATRVIGKEKGGLPMVGFTPRDAYNAISKEKKKLFEGPDEEILIRTLDYNLFGDSIVHDTTYRTNRYDMICAPFVGMNHHGKNIMFAAIRVVFNKSHHRLFVWHLIENSKKHIRHLRELKGLINECKCGDNVWLKKLYNCKEKWCPVFSKECFSGGILSSQRSETINDSLSSRLCAIAGLCGFYSIFVNVVSEWRNKKINDDFCCLQGSQKMISNHVNILTHARDVYTFEIYHLFEEQFLKSMTLHQRLHDKSEDLFIYHVGNASKDQTSDLIKNVVTFNQKENSIFCTCQIYVWRAQMTRKFNDHISISHCNSRSRHYLEEAYLKINEASCG